MNNNYIIGKTLMYSALMLNRVVCLSYCICCSVNYRLIYHSVFD